ncbi:uncharacterized protein LOC132285727 [Cornus florida]|uniref:uncharacterized protein LOC132285727 n=1 Tax=Cornus florida TaxID=4283 RepID=UPI0028970D85|nr:uncharacterized protein LOC132285727 [Cornus florida]
MNRKFLACLLISLYAQVLSSLALESSFTSRNRGIDIPKRVILELEVHGANGTIALRRYGSDREYEAKNGITTIARRSKHGAASAVHRPRPSEKSAVSPLKSRSFFVSALTACVSFALFLLVLL